MSGEGTENPALDGALIQAIQGGLPLVEQPYAALAVAIGVDEPTVLARIESMLDSGQIKRLGVIVRHQELGYQANAMVVWDIPDGQVAAAGMRLGALPFVTLCYQRPRRPPDWPYSLFTMIHGRSRSAVLEQVRLAEQALGLDDIPHEVLFSGRRFKQRGARYRDGSGIDALPGATGAGSGTAPVEVGPAAPTPPTAEGHSAQATAPRRRSLA